MHICLHVLQARNDTKCMTVHDTQVSHEQSENEIIIRKPIYAQLNEVKHITCTWTTKATALQGPFMHTLHDTALYLSKRIT